MIFEKSIGAIVFRKEEDKILFLLLCQATKKNYFGFVKGAQEIGETFEETIKRETMEEAGIEEIKIAPGFEEKESYIFRDIYENPENPPLVKKEVVYYLAETHQKKIKLSEEHTAYKWLEFEEAKNLLKFKGAKAILEKAFIFLNKHDKI
ncbi:diadenosine tetraphosphate hydrolase [bacterium (Candidatus Moisslbacteria) CG12_big_fil_rev_8_21_14_0_65_36_11]|nr:NUDIX domain-containing protein [Candidatus Kuenenbacteria bacterium]OIP77003.1 MAG: hypothetical protein AUK09_00650 [Parcubacteria group bacterium CG2_30_36_38]PIV45867.1 MAG: diadenosine tetraphosphate hydrolase [bacterium (Candidatus Moisslbacteria) CG02_land_8_20_14_3_00_36_53]PIW67730.1 MAG: diadenosine tetraphosphate hydrolase [bacterium (Candidatus Moisslbacteria) CG12_big_fil_rev_8_21_14_0_65_36_11]PIZ90412.1 MAG: diadenosine tetraphosphate hydrolase [bacterium (Candidatus Moisslbac